jgi:sec-independent protein translocase protein TatA
VFRNLTDNPWLLLVLVLVIVLVFGANKLPGAARSLGRSMRIFKSEVKEMREDDAPRRHDDGTPVDPPLHGRVVDDTPGTTRSTQSRTDR